MICRNDHTYSSRCQSPSSRAQKARFCARNARKRGFRRLKAHKNLDFVLEKPEIEGSEGLGAHGLCGRVANSAGNGCRLARDAGVGCWKWLPAGRELAGSWPGAGRELAGSWCGGWQGAGVGAGLGSAGGRCSDTEQKQKRVTAKCHPRLFVV